MILNNLFDNGNSLEVCREIRSFNPPTPIIFYSGETRDAEIKKALAAGADEYLTKPLGLLRLVETVERRLKAASSC